MSSVKAAWTRFLVGTSCSGHLVCVSGQFVYVADNSTCNHNVSILTTPTFDHAQGSAALPMSENKMIRNLYSYNHLAS